MKNSIFWPMMFNPQMAVAVNEGRKNQTRRTKGLEQINENPENFRLMEITENSILFQNKTTKQHIDIIPKMQKGNIIWMRETFGIMETPTKSGIQREFIYKSLGEAAPGLRWKPSLFMPKEAARVFLEIKNIRVERLKDISEADSIGEGISREISAPYVIKWKDYVGEKVFETGKESFLSLWESINGPDSLDKNPFVMIYDFSIIKNAEEKIKLTAQNCFKIAR